MNQGIHKLPTLSYKVRSNRRYVSDPLFPKSKIFVPFQSGRESQLFHCTTFTQSSTLGTSIFSHCLVIAFLLATEVILNIYLSLVLVSLMFNFHKYNNSNVSGSLFPIIFSIHFFSSCNKSLKRGSPRINGDNQVYFCST